MRAKHWLVMLAGAFALFNMAAASAQNAPVLTLGQGDVELHGADVDYWKARKAASFVGVGLDVSKQVSVVGDRGLRIEEVEEGSKAEDARLAVGDLIVAVNGTRLLGLRTEVAERLMAGDDGEKTVFTVLRAGSSQDITVVHDLDGVIGIKWRAADAVVYPLIDYVREKSPAEKWGLKQGDRVVAINGQSMANATPEAAVTALRGPLDGTVTLRVERDGMVYRLYLTRAILPSWDTVFGFKMGSSYSSYGQYATTTIKHFDWEGGIAQQALDDILSDKLYGKADGMVVDLRGTVGSSTDSAARFAARFFDSGTVLRYTDETGTAFSYELIKRSLYKVNRSDYSRVSLGPVGHYEGKVSVVVDGETDGVAVAVAQSLQAAKRAVIIGTPTAHNDVLITFLAGRDADSQPLALLRSTSHVTNVDGAPLTAVTPDHLSVVNPVSDALVVVQGGNPWLQVEPLMWIVTIGGTVIFVVVYVGAMALRRRFGTPAPVEPQPESVEAVKPETEPETEQTANQKTDQSVTRTAGRQLLSVLLICGMVFGFFGFIKLVDRLVAGPPIGGRAEVVVQLFVDGSEASAREAAVVAQLQAELQGGVRFETIDLRQHPEFDRKAHPDQHERFAVDGAPFVWVLTVVYDRHGHEVKRGGSGSGSVYSLTKRNLLRSIRWAAAGYNHEPVIPITRTWPTK